MTNSIDLTTRQRGAPGGGAAASPPEAERFQASFERVHANVTLAIKGKPGEIRLALTCLLAEGHLLIDDVPGTGKTTMAKAIAASMGGEFSRIQFTPDLLPTDVTGSMVYNSSDSTFVFHQGGVFANVVLADEINRASPKTQSALLEVMEEHQVTVDSIVHLVPRPFVVIATQNPVELDGTYHLPEAQIDRFMMRMSLGYPGHDAEVEAIANRLAGMRPELLSPVISVDEFASLIDVGMRVHVADSILRYSATLASTTRSMGELRLGVSPRGSLALVRAGQVWAASQGRHFVSAQDVRELAPFVLGHRMLLSPEAQLQGITASALVSQLLAAVPLPDDRY